MTEAAPADRELARDLRRPQVLAIVVGAMIGTGIYLRPASIAQALQSPAWILTVWAAGALLVLCGALTYARLARRFPGTGGEYLFLQSTLGRLPAFLYGWMRVTVGPATTGSMAVAATVFLGDIVPLAGPRIQFPLPWGHGLELIDLGPRQCVAVILVLGLAWINTQGVGRAGAFQLLVTICKVSGLALLLAVMVAFNGWANAAIVGGEIKDAERTVPWALVTGTLAVTSLYLIANLAYLHTLPLSEILSANSTAYPNAPSVASKAVRQALGAEFAKTLPVLFAVSALGTAHCNMLLFPRLVLAMARDGLLPKSLAEISPATATPNRAIWALAAVAAAFALLGTYDRLSNMAAFAVLVFFALNSAGFLKMQRGAAGSEPSRGDRSTTVAATIFLLGSGALIAASMARGSPEVLTAAALMSAGLPAYFTVEYRRARRRGR